MLPSMPILFSRESQEAFGNKIQPSTSFFSQNSVPKFVINPEVFQVPLEAPTEAPKHDDSKNKKELEKKKKEQPNFDANALENALVRSYYQRVQSRFSSNSSVPANKFVQFQNILRNFNPNVETPVDLYKKIEELFGEEHKDIIEDFLLFLKPGQAAEVGRFMDRFMLLQMTSFINLLHNTFSRKPTVLRKVLRALTNGLNSGNSEEMKSRVLPHFRSHPRLTQIFKSLFPDERPADSLYESGVDMINESFLTNDKGYDVWEYEDESEKKSQLDAKEGLDTMYLNGRVFLQHGRMLRSARVTYPYSKEPYRVHARRLAPAHCHLSPPDLDDDDAQKKNKPPKRTRKQTKSPTKKDVNDNTKKDCTLLSPKPRKTQQKTKNGKNDCKTELKRERKDSKHIAKKEEPKSKQAKIDAIGAKTEAIGAKTDAIGAKTEAIGAKTESIGVKTEAIGAMSEAIGAKTVPEVKEIEIMNEPSLKNEQTIEVKSVETNIIASMSCEAKNNDLKSNNWTRDEDKTMLQVLKGEAGSEKVFGRIRELLPHRSATEIKERFCHVMTLLQQMAVGEVT